MIAYESNGYEGNRNIGSALGNYAEHNPLTAIMAFFQLVILRKPIDNLKEFLLGFVFAILGLHLFLKGTTMSLLPLGGSVGRNIHILERRWLIVMLAFVIGYLGTLVEPALKALALEVEELSIGTIRHKVLIHGVAVGFGLGMAIGVTKILLNISYIKIVAPLLVLVIILAFLHRNLLARLPLIRRALPPAR